MNSSGDVMGSERHTGAPFDRFKHGVFASSMACLSLEPMATNSGNRYGSRRGIEGRGRAENNQPQGVNRSAPVKKEACVELEL